MRQIASTLVVCVLITFVSVCKTVDQEKAQPAAPVLQPSVQIRAQSHDNTLWIRIGDSVGWLEPGQPYLIRYGTQELDCEQHPAEFQGVLVTPGSISHRIASTIPFKDQKSLFLCMTQNGRLLHKEKLAISASNPFASLDGAPPIVNYARRCAEEIAYIPPINCLDGETLRVTVQGQEPSTYPPGLQCDRPAMLDYQDRAEGQCVPYSRIQKITFEDPDAVGVIICRRYKLRDPNDPLFDDVSIIIHRKSTGATCFFQMPEDVGIARDGRRVPPPHELPTSTPDDSPNVKDFWLPPAETAQRYCHQCHDSDPFIHSPYVAGSGQVPKAPDTPYRIVGKEFADWPSTQAVTVEGGNLCTSCHRVGDRFSCESFLDYSVGLKSIKGVLASFYQFPDSHWMPPPSALLTAQEWQDRYQEQVNQIRACCQDPSKAGCKREPITENIGF
ncbi:hypothetical protein [Pseudobacteriovorax antillogorgiicola]|uniref:Uncharacterized protein n=1 Tax=Pseudobacteriovorax antillogorgiicola TaxID=1513793 RepID=A0A1Y6B9I3_9BACT|nr:hypothetical protein [Pseudobacteriovorax antillogorgiicola]TCS58516.1 hypothetical protein EDD56_10229 [Pseudobacteriovorax antillogorgiicola]SME98070.1 hypothetical protein SAMN06296036_102414 [Pseudobacteriovorax antillogorgiicola]